MKYLPMGGGQVDREIASASPGSFNMYCSPQVVEGICTDHAQYTGSKHR